MVKQHSTTPLIVKKAIKNAEGANFHWMDLILLAVLNNENLNETLQSLEAGGGWEYVLYLYEYQTMQNSIKTAWEMHQEAEMKKSR